MLYIYLGEYRFSVSTCVSFRKISTCIILKIVHISFTFSNVWHEVVQNIPFLPLVSYVTNISWQALIFRIPLSPEQSPLLHLSDLDQLLLLRCTENERAA